MKYLLALSGGLDSIALLHLFYQQRTDAIALRAAHIHHGLNQNADQWAAHCQIICQQLQIPLEVITVKVQPQPGESLEAAAREARYTALAKCLAPDEILVTAHHQNDQAETFLLHALRGAGPKGLSAMPTLKQFSCGWHWRPLLNFSRETLVVYAEQHQLHWVTDDSNENILFDRNYLRHKIIPLLEKRWPKVVKNFARSAEIQADLADYLDELLTPVWERWPEEVAKLDVHEWYKSSCHCERSVAIQVLIFDRVKTSKPGSPRFARDDGGILPLSLLKDLAKPLQNWLIRSWIKNITDISLPKKQLERIWQEIIFAREDKQPKLKLENFYLRRYAEALWLTEETTAPPGFRFASSGLENHDVRYRQGGERFHPAGRQHSQSLKKLFHEWKIPPWERDRIPLIYVGDELVQVGDIKCSCRAD